MLTLREPPQGCASGRDSVDAMGDKQDDDPKPGFAISASADGVKAEASEGALDRLFRFFAPNRFAKGIAAGARATADATVLKAQAERVAELLAGDVTPRPIDAVLLQEFLGRQLERSANGNAALAATADLLAHGFQVDRKELPPGDASPGAERAETHPDWFRRWLREAEDITEGPIRDYYSRLLAGELMVPGTFSLKTLSVLRDLDGLVARLFDSIKVHRLGNDAIPRIAYLESGVDFPPGRRLADLARLRDAGLVSAMDNAHLVLNSKRHPDGSERVEVLVGGEKVSFQVPVPLHALVVPVDLLTAAGQELLTLSARTQRDDRKPVMQWIAKIAAQKLGKYAHEIPVRVHPDGASELLLDFHRPN